MSGGVEEALLHARRPMIEGQTVGEIVEEIVEETTDSIGSQIGAEIAEEAATGVLQGKERKMTGAMVTTGGIV